MNQYENHSQYESSIMDSKYDSKFITEKLDNKSEKYISRFKLNLKGVERKSITEQIASEEDRIIWSEKCISALFTNLGVNESLVIHYKWIPRANRSPKFSIEIIGTAIQDNRLSALNTAMTLEQSIQTMLGQSDIGYKLQLSEKDIKKTNKSSRYCYSIKPAHITIPIHNTSMVGFTMAEDTENSLAISFPTDTQITGFNAITRYGNRLNHGFTLELHIEGFKLKDKDLSAIQVAFEQLRNGGVGQLRQNGSHNGKIYNDAIVANTLYRLDRWSGEPEGYRVRCIVNSDGCLPKSQLDIIGKELFRTTGIKIEEVKSNLASKNYQHNSNLADLVECYHSTDVQLNFLPDDLSLNRIGIPRSYPTISSELPSHGIELGYCENQVNRIKIRIPEVDRSRHSYVIGSTGTGKSTLLCNMITQDMENNRGVCVIDPHGDLFEQLVSNIPKERERDVILIDLTDTEYSVGINILECSEPNRELQENFVVNELISIINKLYNMDIAGGPMFESYMRNALFALLGVRDKSVTLMDVVRFFEDSKFRKYITLHSENALAVSFWLNSAEKATGETDFKNIAPYITSKLNQFTQNSILRPIIGQNNTIDFRQAMDEGKIILVNLAKGLLGELDTKLLGMILVGNIFNASLSRMNLPQSERKRFYLYVDEFQNIATPTVIGLMSEARKFGLSMIMANQHLGQFHENNGTLSVVDAILGNVATMLFFRLGAIDAQKLESYTTPYLNALDLQQLPDFTVACRMLNNNIPVPSFVFNTHSSNRQNRSEREKANKEYLRQLTRNKFARHRKTIEENIKADWIKSIR